MALWDKLKGEFIDIVQWLDDTNDTLVYRFERYGNEIKYNAKLVVREGQMAAFINEGQLADVFKPGTYTLTTQNLPILATLKGWKYGFESPFKAEVYFCSTRQFTNLKWGTPGPVTMRDPEFGAVRVTAFGLYSIKVKDPALFIREIVGTDGTFTTERIEDNLRGKIGTRIKEVMPDAGIPIIDLESKVIQLGETLKVRICPGGRGARAGTDGGAGPGRRAAGGGGAGHRQGRRHAGHRQHADLYPVRDRQFDQRCRQ